MPTLVELWLGRGKGAFERTPLVLPLLTFYVVVLIYQLTLPLESAYVLLFFGAVLVLVIYDLISLRRERRMKTLRARGVLPPVAIRDWRSSFDIPNYTVSEAPIGILLGIALAGGPFLLFVFFTGQTFRGANLSIPDFLRALVTNVIVLAVVEEFDFRYAFTKVYGGILPQVMFAVSHPAVRQLLIELRFADAVIPFFYFFMAGLAFQQLVFMGQASDVPEDYRKFFGLPLANGIHGMLDTILILFPGLQILGVIVGPFQILSPTGSSPLALLIPLAFFLALVYVARRRRPTSTRRRWFIWPRRSSA